ncbi:MAG: type 4a pilus biogenesis protein PilO [Deltaproteobacteria bacterium]|nr:type 4a pilus biogenesis protein PilO [Deltaproteobacteria bacterium]
MDINLDTIKQLPPQYKAIALVVILVLLGYAYYAVFLQKAMNERSTLAAKKVQLDQQITEKSRLASQKGQYLKEVEQLEEDLKTVLMKLPNEREIPELFQSVSVSGKGTGIEFLLFQPQAVPKPKPVAQKAPAKGKKAPPKPAAEEKLYEEVPLRISIKGGFHNTVQFFEKVANLPRIINVENVSMAGGRNAKGKGDRDTVATSCVMKTYMFLGKKDEKKK